MSSRVYPALRDGQQLRVFLPNFWMKLVKPTHTLLPNQVEFIVSPQMTRYDVKQYLEKIYNVPVVLVATHNKMGVTKRNKAGYIIKEEDIKIAYVTLEKDSRFTFPDLFPESKKDEDKKEMKQIEEIQENYIKRVNSSADRKGVPSWFTL